MSFLIKSTAVSFIIFCITVISLGKDPFQEGGFPNKIQSASWEELIVDPNRFAGDIVAIDGWFRIDFKDQNEITLRLYKDKTAIDFERPRSSILIAMNKRIEESKTEKLKALDNLNLKYGTAYGVLTPIPGDYNDFDIAKFEGQFAVVVQDLGIVLNTGGW